jgi:hypothetical protein
MLLGIGSGEAKFRPGVESTDVSLLFPPVLDTYLPAVCIWSCLGLLTIMMMMMMMMMGEGLLFGPRVSASPFPW